MRFSSNFDLFLYWNLENNYRTHRKNHIIDDFICIILSGCDNEISSVSDILKILVTQKYLI